MSKGKQMPNWENRLQGLKTMLRLGDTITINGDLKIQFRMLKGERIWLCLSGPKEKYHIDRSNARLTQKVPVSFCETAE